MSHTPDDPSVLKPGERPIFVDPERAAAVADRYPGYVEPEIPPTFDEQDDPSFLIERQEGRGRPEGPSRGIESRYIAIARCNAIGLTTNQIAKRFNLSPSRVSLIVKTDFVQAEIRKYRDKLFDQDLAMSMKDLGPDALNVLTTMLNADGEKLKDRVEAAKWLLEKLTGKPKQEINVESGTISAFMEMLRGMQDRGEKLDQPIDVTPTERSEGGDGESKALTAVSQEHDFSSWIQDNLKK